MADPKRIFRNAPDGAVEVVQTEPGPYSYSPPKELVVMRFSAEDVAEIRKLTESGVEILNAPKAAPGHADHADHADHPVEYPTGPVGPANT